MARLSLKTPIPESYDPREFIRWYDLTSRTKAPQVGVNLIEEGFKKALAGTDLNPFIVALIAAVRTKWFSNLTNETDIFGFGFGGSIYDQTVMAISRFQDFAAVEDLPSLTETQKWQVAELFGKFVVYTERNPIGPAPMPEPPAPAPAPAPAPTRPQPALWWDCPRCHEHNPPLRDKCIKCRAARPGEKPPEPPTPAPEPKPEEPKPTPAPAKPSFDWKKTLMAVVGIMGATGWLVKMFLPGWATQVWDTIVAIAKALAAGG